MSGGNAGAGAAGAFSGELATRYIAEKYWGANTPEKIAALGQEDREQLSLLGTLAAGLAGGMAGNSSAAATSGAIAGKNAVENNFVAIPMPLPPIAGQTTPQAEANAFMAKKLDAAIKEFGEQQVKQCLSGGTCPGVVLTALLAINAMTGNGDDKTASTPNMGQSLTEKEKAELGGTGAGTPGGWGPEDEEKGRSDKQKTTIDELMSSSSKGRETTGRSKLFERAGGNDAANKEFNSLNPSEIKDIPGGRVGKLSDGRTIIVRERSSDGRPTLEIQSGKNRIKFRYDE
nr:VENN motif pre-toxin domain-containing protein [Duffyella gerundensis]